MGAGRRTGASNCICICICTSKKKYDRTGQREAWWAAGRSVLALGVSDRLELRGCLYELRRRAQDEGGRGLLNARHGWAGRDGVAGCTRGVAKCEVRSAAVLLTLADWLESRAMTVLGAVVN